MPTATEKAACEVCGVAYGLPVDEALSMSLRSDYTYEVSHHKSGAIVIIPSVYNGLPVTAIGEEAFCHVSGVTKVVIPDSVTIIKSEAFRVCYNLESLLN